MVKCLGSNELHLNKELATLLKARSLRDPAASLSRRSSVGSSTAAAYRLNSGNAKEDNQAELNESNRKIKVSPRNAGYGQKKAHLYNWTCNSGKYIGTGGRFDDCGHATVEKCSENGLKKTSDSNSRSDTRLEVIAKACTTRDSNTKSIARKMIRKSRRTGSSRKRVIKHSSLSKLPSLPSNYFGVVRSGELSDKAGHCDSEDPRQSEHKLISGDNFSHTSSPFFTQSRCRNRACPSKHLRFKKKEISSYPCSRASTSSYNTLYRKNGSTIGSWDGVTSGDEFERIKVRSQGCGIPSCWPKQIKDTGCGGWYSSSFSDNLRTKESHMLCGGPNIRRKNSFSVTSKCKNLKNSIPGLPLLTNGCNGGGSFSNIRSDKLSTNYDEIDLEALSQFDGRRWSMCQSQEGLGLVQVDEANLDMPGHRSLSEKYRPRLFDEIVGQANVVRSLCNAILMGRIAPAFLFQGPHGTGKTSIAKIFVAALNCQSSEDVKPCGFCRECNDAFNRKGSNIIEINAADKNGIEKLRRLLKCMPAASTISRYQVFVVDEFHLVSWKIRSAFIKYLEELPPQILFIFITTEAVNLPRAFLSRCRKYFFSKIKEEDILFRLRRLCEKEKLDADLDALNLIASNSDGSLCDAEAMLDQLSFLGKKITSYLVYDLIGGVSDEKLLDLLEVAMSSDTVETVKRSRELMCSGVDPVALMSQLAGLIMDIIAGTRRSTSLECSGRVKQSLTEAELGRLRQALNTVSDAEKQLRLSSDRPTWFTAALLQLGSASKPDQFRRNSNQSSKVTISSISGVAKENKREEIIPHYMFPSNEVIPASCSSLLHGISGSCRCSKIKKLSSDKLLLDNHSVSRNLIGISHLDDAGRKIERWYAGPEDLSAIWRQCIQGCHSKVLQKFLSAHGKLESFTKSEDTLTAYIIFGNDKVASRAEKFLSAIANSIQIVLGKNVEVRIGTKHANKIEEKSVFASLTSEHKNVAPCKNLATYINVEADATIFSCNCVSHVTNFLHRTMQKHRRPSIEEACFQSADNPTFMFEDDDGTEGEKCNEEEFFVYRSAKSAFNEQRLGSACLRSVEKGMPDLAIHSRSEKNQVLPPSSTAIQSHNASSMACMLEKQWEEDLANPTKALRVCDSRETFLNCTDGRTCHNSLSNNHVDSNKDNFCNYDSSGPGCNRLLCWKSQKPCRRKCSHPAAAGVHCNCTQGG